MKVSEITFLEFFQKNFKTLMDEKRRAAASSKAVVKKQKINLNEVVDSI